MAATIPPGAVGEQAVLLGPRKSLVAVVTKVAPGAAAVPLPTAGDGALERPMIVILNSGIVHRVGANRMSVKLARALAAAGFDTVRFDLSGIGDSEPRADTLEPLDAAVADVKEALDSLEASRKVSRFVLIGLCSGANHSVIHAGNDPRVIGAVLLEPSIPPSYRHYVHHYGRRILKRDSWVRAVQGKNHVLLRLKQRFLSRSQGPESIRAPESAAPSVRVPKITDADVRQFLEAAYQKLIERRLPLLVVLTGESWYYRGAFVDAFPRLRFGPEVGVELLKEADHVFTPPASCERLVRLIVDWTRNTLPNVLVPPRP